MLVLAGFMVARSVGRAFGTALLICSVGSALGSCALAYTDASGTQHVIGFVNIEVKPANESRLAGDVTAFSTVGISLLAGERGSSLALGYNRITTAAFRDNSVAFGPFGAPPRS
jgi:hypothetical protein